MNKSTNADLKLALRTFGKGLKLPKGYTMKFNTGVISETIFGNYGKTCGTPVGAIKVYEEPKYDILNADKEIAFSIGIADGTKKIYIMGNSNMDYVSTKEEAILVGLEYEKNGW